MNMFLGCLGISFILFGIGAWIDYIDRRSYPKPDLDEISTVCMDCNRHMGGPLPGRARLVSHGLCPDCAKRWQSAYVTEAWPYDRN